MIGSSLWKRGEYTDDTQMALLIAESLLEKNGFVASHLAQRFEVWMRTAKDVGNQTRNVIRMSGYVDYPENCSLLYRANHPDASAGNGALMRCAPVALFYLNAPDQLVEISRSSARMTHHDPKAESSCVILNLWIRSAICDGERDGRAEALALLNKVESPIWQRLARIENYEEDHIVSSGYTVHTLEAAAWSFLTTESYEEAVIRAANLGDDADTVAAVSGALAGAYYGYAAIPERWRSQLQDEVKIRDIALALGRHADAALG